MLQNNSENYSFLIYKIHEELKQRNHIVNCDTIVHVLEALGHIKSINERITEELKLID